MTRTRTTAAAVFSAFALSTLALTAVPAAQADDAGTTDPCATQQAQLDRASAKYDALQAKFAAHPTTKNKKAKKAQVKRVEKAQARLDRCQAASA
jgi:hypothetical protein